MTQISLKEWLKKEGLKHKRFAEKLGINPPDLSAHITGRHIPSLSLLRKISALTNGEVGLYSPWGNELKEVQE